MNPLAWLRRREVGLEDYLRRTKKVYVNGVIFKIRKVDMADHVAGLNVVMKLWDLYAREKPKSGAQVADDYARIRKFTRDFIYAGVVSPKLTMKAAGEPGVIHVDEVTADAELSQKLCAEIIQYSYAKKK